MNVPYCPRCERPFWYPRSACPCCLATQLEERELRGESTVIAVAGSVELVEIDGLRVIRRR